MDKPANARPFAVVKSEEGEVVERDGDVLVIDRSVSSAVAAASAAASRFGTVFAALAGPSPVTKALDVNETAREAVNSHISKVYWRIDQLYTLLNAVDGTHLDGGLDQAIGMELSALAGAFMAMAAEFGVVAAPEPMPLEKADEVTKAGAKMAKGNAAIFAQAMGALHQLAEAVLSEDDMSKMCGSRRMHKADDAVVPDIEAELNGIDAGLTAALELVKAHDERLRQLETVAVTEAQLKTAVAKAAARTPRTPARAPVSNAITTADYVAKTPTNSALTWGTDQEIAGSSDI